MGIGLPSGRVWNVTWSYAVLRFTPRELLCPTRHHPVCQRLVYSCRSNGAALSLYLPAGFHGAALLPERTSRGSRPWHATMIGTVHPLEVDRWWTVYGCSGFRDNYPTIAIQNLDALLFFVLQVWEPSNRISLDTLLIARKAKSQGVTPCMLHAQADLICGGFVAVVTPFHRLRGKSSLLTASRNSLESKQLLQLETASRLPFRVSRPLRSSKRKIQQVSDHGGKVCHPFGLLHAHARSNESEKRLFSGLSPGGHVAWESRVFADTLTNPFFGKEDGYYSPSQGVHIP
jgi:hypothetical protein